MNINATPGLIPNLEVLVVLKGSTRVYILGAWFLNKFYETDAWPGHQSFAFECLLQLHNWRSFHHPHFRAFPRFAIFFFFSVLFPSFLASHRNAGQWT